MYFADAKIILDSQACPKCHGSGTITDAEPGDIFCNTVSCPRCKGTGWKEQEYHLFPISTIEGYLATQDDERHKEEYTTLRQRATSEMKAFIRYLRKQETNG